MGDTDQGHSRQQNYSLSQNCYIYVSGGIPSMLGTPGTTLFAAAASEGIDRGFHVFNDELYQVSGATLEKVNQDGTRTDLGTIPGTARCIFANDGTDMFIVTGGTIYRFNTSLSTVTDSNFESPESISYLNSQFIYDGSGSRFMVSDVGDGSSINSVNIAAAESDPDKLNLTYTFDQYLYLMGSKTIEPWYNSGVGSPPFERVDTAMIQKGVGSIFSVANTDSFLYFLGDDLNIYQLKSTQVTNVSNAGIAKEITAMSKTDDAIGFTFNLEGMDFYYLAFPTGNKSFLYSETVDQWFTMTYLTDGDRHLASSYAFVYGKHLIADRRNGRVLEWSLDIQDEAGEVIQRRRILPNINGSMLKTPNTRLMMSSIEIEMQKGLGLATGQGSDPILMVEMSFDGGHTWDTIYSLRSGEGGVFDGKVKADTMRSFY
ncbi:MAG: hypothetical protein IH937_03375, partial [Acidobacteria bacterium]|nr:hypothetical protein [Acidobacteriota bacterium]